MYKNKPLIIAKRPFWRHPVFPWGWYSLVQDRVITSECERVQSDGYYKPKDGGGGVFYWYRYEMIGDSEYSMVSNHFEPKMGKWKSKRPKLNGIH